MKTLTTILTAAALLTPAAALAANPTPTPTPEQGTVFTGTSIYTSAVTGTVKVTPDGVIVAGPNKSITLKPGDPITAEIAREGVGRIVTVDGAVLDGSNFTPQAFLGGSSKDFLRGVLHTETVDGKEITSLKVGDKSYPIQNQDKPWFKSLATRFHQMEGFTMTMAGVNSPDGFVLSGMMSMSRPVLSTPTSNNSGNNSSRNANTRVVENPAQPNGSSTASTGGAGMSH